LGTEGLLRCTAGEAGQALQIYIDIVDPSLTGTPHEAVAGAPLPSQEVQGRLVGGLGIHLEMQRLFVRKLKITQQGRGISPQLALQGAELRYKLLNFLAIPRRIKTAGDHPGAVALAQSDALLGLGATVQLKPGDTIGTQRWRHQAFQANLFRELRRRWRTFEQDSKNT